MTDYSGQIINDRDKVFWSKVDIKKDHECWNWKHYLNSDGYGQFWTGNTFVPPHRYVWELTRKCKVPEGKIIMHLCDNRACCNPNHLICGTQLDNMQDKIMKGRLVPPHKTANPSLYSGEIWLIRRLLSSKRYSQALISKMFKVHQSTISHINTSDRWLCKEGGYV